MCTYSRQLGGLNLQTCCTDNTHSKALINPLKECCLLLRTQLLCASLVMRLIISVTLIIISNTVDCTKKPRRRPSSREVEDLFLSTEILSSANSSKLSSETVREKQAGAAVLICILYIDIYLADVSIYK